MLLVNNGAMEISLSPNAELEALRKELEEARATLRMRDEYLNQVAHELRTPLTAIRGLVNMQYDGDYDDAAPDERKRLQHNLLLSVEQDKSSFPRDILMRG